MILYVDHSDGGGDDGASGDNGQQFNLLDELVDVGVVVGVIVVVMVVERVGFSSPPTHAHATMCLL